MIGKHLLNTSGKNKVLITGGAGYIGTILTNYLLTRGYIVLSVDIKKNATEIDALLKKKYKNNYSFYSIAVENGIENIIRRHTDIKCVIHLAGMVNVDESMADPHKYFYNNSIVTNHLLHSMAAYNLENIVFTSTSAVYGDCDGKVDEAYVTEPSNVYGGSKLMAEQMIKTFAKIHNVRFVILRCFNVVGASEEGDFGDARDPSCALLTNAVGSVINKSSFYVTSPVWSLDGKGSVRDYVDVLDLCSAIESAMKFLFNQNPSDTFNIGSGEPKSIQEVISEIERISGGKISIKKGENRRGEVRNISAKITKARRLLGWRPQRSLEQSIASLILWYKKKYLL